MPSQPCGLHRRHSRIESVVPYTNALAKKGQVYFGRFWTRRFAALSRAAIMDLSLLHARCHILADDDQGGPAFY